MNRHEAVTDIIRDHVVQLDHAKRLADSTKTNPQDALKAARGYLAYHNASIRPHLEEEELFMVPLVAGSFQGRWQRSEELLRNATDEVRITMMDPQFFRGAILHLAEALREHVAFCEANLIPELSYNLEPEQFEAMGSKLHEFRKRNRPQAVGEARTEPSNLA